MSWKASLSPADRKRLAKADVPDWTAPMLATLSHAPFSHPAWVYERKLDGERCLIFRNGQQVRILSRNRQSLNDTYPELVEALARQPLGRFVLDAEIVAFDGAVTSFSRLQKRIGMDDPDRARQSPVAVKLYLFDILHRGGYDLTELPLRRRKRLLKDAIDFDDPLRYTPHRNKQGEAFYHAACRKGWEGVIAKAADSPYAHRRSKQWLKFKCTHRQEFVVGGFTDPTGRRKGFGALLLGYYEEGALRFAGKVGTGFDDQTLESLRSRMDRLERKRCPFHVDDAPSGQGVHWLRPSLVAEVAFTEWTGERRLRHPRYLGLRPDKRAKDVVRERAPTA